MTNQTDGGPGDDLGGGTLAQDHSRDVGASVGGWFGVEADDMGEVVRLELKDGSLDVETASGTSDCLSICRYVCIMCSIL